MQTLTSYTSEPVSAGTFGRLIIERRGLIPCAIQQVSTRGTVLVQPLDVGGEHWLPPRRVAASAVAWIMDQADVRAWDLPAVMWQ